MLVVLPEMQEQREIVYSADCIKQIIQKRSRGLGLLDQLLESTFMEQFGDPYANEQSWETLTLDSVRHTIRAGRLPKLFEGPDTDGDAKQILHLDAISSGWFDANLTRKNTPRPYDSSKAINPQSGDILMIYAGGESAIGKACLVEHDYPGLVVPENVYIIKLNEYRVTKEFFLGLIQNKIWQQSLLVHSSGSSAGTMRISAKLLKTMTILRPPMALQRAFSARYQQISSTRQKMLSAIETLNELQQTILGKAIQGEWRKDEGLSLEYLLAAGDFDRIGQDPSLIQEVVNHFIEFTESNDLESLVFPEPESYDRMVKSLFHLMEKDLVANQWNESQSAIYPAFV